MSNEVQLIETFECVDENGARFWANADQIREQGFKRVDAPPLEEPPAESKPKRRGNGASKESA